jgi:hypothetical protein
LFLPTLRCDSGREERADGSFGSWLREKTFLAVAVVCVQNYYNLVHRDGGTHLSNPKHAQFDVLTPNQAQFGALSSSEPELILRPAASL